MQDQPKGLYRPLSAAALPAGTISRSRPSRFASNSPVNMLTPVALPPGRFMLATSPILTGSSPTPNTIGMVAVRRLGRQRGKPVKCGNHSPPSPHQIVGERRYTIAVEFGPSVFNRNVLICDVVQLGQAPKKSVNTARHHRACRIETENADHRHICGQRSSGKRKCHRACHARDELPSPHAHPRSTGGIVTGPISIGRGQRRLRD